MHCELRDTLHFFVVMRLCQATNVTRRTTLSWTARQKLNCHGSQAILSFYLYCPRRMQLGTCRRPRFGNEVVLNAGGVLPETCSEHSELTDMPLRNECGEAKRPLFLNIFSHSVEMSTAKPALAESDASKSLLLSGIIVRPCSSQNFPNAPPVLD